MNNRRFVRKIGYLLGMAALLVPLFLLGQPAVHTGTNTREGGGKLSQLRDRYGIGQANLGQIDPASESMRLATLGMRGIAVAWLWQKAEYYKEEQFFDRLAATLNQIALLQPHFIKVWESQAHNLAYNVSAEFDDYRQRYAWVKKGINYLVSGTEYNQRQPILQWFLGKYVTHKLGRSDEQTQFRELFRNDDDFHDYLQSAGLSNLRSESLGPDRKPDNWLAGRLWFLKAIELVKSGALINKPEVFFFGEPAWSRMYYAEAIEEEGILDDHATFAWRRAGEEWKEHGERSLLTTYGTSIKMLALPRLLETQNELQAEFDELISDASQQLLTARLDDLSPEEAYVVQKDPAERTEQEQRFYRALRERVFPNLFTLAEAVDTDKRVEAIALATRLSSVNEEIRQIQQYRNLCNYDYWQMRAAAEQSPVTLAARRQMFEADLMIDEADLSGATALYEKAWLNWNAVFHRYPDMMLETVADEVKAAVDRYLAATDTIYDEDFALYEFMTYKNIRDGNRNDEENQRRLDRMKDEAYRWEEAMQTPALIDNDVVPTPEPAENAESQEDPAEKADAQVEATSNAPQSAVQETKPDVATGEAAVDETAEATEPPQSPVGQRPPKLLPPE